MGKKDPLFFSKLGPSELIRLIHDLNNAKWRGLHDNLYGPEIRIGIGDDGSFFVNLDSWRARQFREAISDQELKNRYKAKAD